MIFYYNVDLKTRCSTQPCTYIAYTSRRHPSRNVQKKIVAGQWSLHRIHCLRLKTLSLFTVG